MIDYQVRLDAFEGPLDLLLHLIRENEMDIWDIPMAAITQQYLEYIEIMELLNLDVAGEFLFMASTLMYIKSRMLLPHSEEEEVEEEEEVDPREELVRRLLEYKKYREAAQELDTRKVLDRDQFLRGFFEEIDQGKDEESYHDVTLFDLLQAFNGVLKSVSVMKPHEIELDKVSVREKMEVIIDRLGREGHITLHSLFDRSTTRGQVVATVLALLELIKMKTVSAFQGENFGPIRIVSSLQTLH